MPIKSDGSTEFTQQGFKTVLFLNNGETLEHVISANEDLDHEVNKINSKNHHHVSFHHHQHHNNEANHPQTMTTIPSHNNDFSNVNNNTHVAQTASN